MTGLWRPPRDVTSRGIKRKHAPRPLPPVPVVFYEPERVRYLYALVTLHTMWTNHEASDISGRAESAARYAINHNIN